MNKIILFIFTLLTFSIAHATDWEDNWIEAIQYKEQNDYTSAEAKLDLAIAELDSKSDTLHSYIFLDRAEIYIIQNRPLEALEDLNKALSSENLSKDDKIKGYLSRFSIYASLGQEEEAIKDYDKFKGMCTNFPKTEYTKKSVIVRNVPECECAREMMQNFYVESKICEKLSDIKAIDSKTWIIKRKICNCPETNYASPKTREIDCNYWCNKMSIAANLWCAKVFPTWGCKAACILAVEGLKDVCHLCCRNGDFHGNCVKPFEDILKAMSKTVGKLVCEPQK